MKRSPENNYRQESRDYYHEDSDWQESAPDPARVNRARSRLGASFERETSDRPFKSATKRQLNPKFVGALAAIGFAAVITFDTTFNGSSSFVIEHPEAATTALTGLSAAIGALAYKLTKNLDSRNTESLNARRAKEQRREKW